MAGYIDRNLVPGEKVLYRTHLHWMLVFGRTAGYWLLTAAVGALVSWQRFPLKSSWPRWVVVGFYCVAALSTMRSYFHYMASEFGLTDQRVLLKVGLMRSHTLEIFLGKIESIAVDQTLTGRLLGYGSVIISGTGGMQERFDDIHRPRAFQRKVEAQISSHGLAVVRR